MKTFKILVQHKKTKKIKRFKNIADAKLFVKYININYNLI